MSILGYAITCVYIGPKSAKFPKGQKVEEIFTWVLRQDADDGYYFLMRRPDVYQDVSKPFPIVAAGKQPGVRP